MSSLKDWLLEKGKSALAEAKKAFNTATKGGVPAIKQRFAQSGGIKQFNPITNFLPSLSAGTKYEPIVQGAFSWTPVGNYPKQVFNLLSKKKVATYEPTTQKDKNLYNLSAGISGTVALAPIKGATTTAKILTGNITAGSLFNTAVKAGSNVISGKPIGQDLKEAAIEGGIFGTQFTPIDLGSKAILSPLLTKILKGTDNKLSTYIKLAQNATNQKTKTEILKLAATRFGQNVVKEAITGGAGFGTFGLIQPAASNEERIKNIKENAIIGSVFGGGTKILGTVTDLTLNNFLKSRLEARGKLTQQELRKSQRGAILNTDVGTKPAEPVKTRGEENLDFIFGDDKPFKAKPRAGSYSNITEVNDPLFAKVQLQNTIMERINRAGAKQKVNFFDYLRTPDRVFAKIGLKNESSVLRKGYESYKSELTKEIDRVTQWANSLPKESNEKIFRALDGEKIQLTNEEVAVGREIRDYLKFWANRLKLPYEKRITKYIPHIFDKGEIAQEFDPQIARMIEGKVAKSVYDPFLEQRTGVQKYAVDTWRALDAYVKRAVRKANLDPALEQISKAAESLDQESFDYVQKYISRVNMRPTSLDNLVDNAIKSLVGYKYTGRPTAYLTGKLRTMIYRATLGLNLSSPIRNLSQGSNTYAVLGEKYTIKGYLRLLKGDFSELYEHGVLNDAISERNVRAVKNGLEKVDPILFKLFDWTEKINRGSAFFGAKAKALDKGMSEPQAIEFAKKVVRDTQFTFGSIDLPLAISSDLTKTATQYMNYSIKQVEFLAERLQAKDFIGLVRYIGAQIAYISTIGTAIGMGYNEIIPLLKFEPPAFQLGKNIKALISPDINTTRSEALEGIAGMVIPGGTQIKKTLGGIDTFSRGGSYTKNGQLRYPVKQNLTTGLQMAAFGKWSTPEAKKYVIRNFKRLNKADAARYRKLVKKGYDPYRTFSFILEQAEKRNKQKAKIKAAKEANKARLVHL